jgi:putative membrane protein
MADTSKEKWFTLGIVLLSVLIPAVVFILLFTAKPTLEHNIPIRLLPGFHATFNLITSILLLVGYFFIRIGKVKIHRMLMSLALLCSVLFLISYITYHSLAESTPFGGTGFIKYVYFFILITHIILAVVIVPLVLITYIRALMGNFEKHRKIAKWTLPIWFYVAISGVVVYLMISPYYT